MWIEAFAVAWAAPECEPMDETLFRSYVLDAQSGIDRGDVELPAAILTEVVDRLPCMTFAPQPRMWAELMVSLAIVEFSQGGDWQGPLAAALRIRPAIDRGVGSGHPIFSYRPPSAGPSGPPVPAGARILVDGSPSAVLPSDQGTWLVQKTDGRFWNTLLLRDQPMPEGWAAAPVVAPPRIVAWTRLGGLVGFGETESNPSWRSDLYARGAGAERGGLALGVAGDVHATFFSPFGVHASGRMSWMPGAPGLDLRVSGIFERGPLSLGGGVGVSSVEVFVLPEPEVDPDTRRGDPEWQLLRYAEGTVMVVTRSERSLPVDLGLTVGGGAALAVLDLEAGVTGRIGGTQLCRLSAAIVGRHGTFVYSSLPDDRLLADAFRVLLRVDLVLGGD